MEQRHDRCLQSSALIVWIYFILSSDINAYLKQIEMVFLQSDTILYQSLVIDIISCHCVKYHLYLFYLWLISSYNFTSD